MVKLRFISLLLLTLKCCLAESRAAYLPDVKDHTFADLKVYKIHHYAISVTVDMDSQEASKEIPRIAGNVIINYTRLKKKTSKLRLDTNSISVESVYLLNNKGEILRRLKQERNQKNDDILGKPLVIRMTNTPRRGHIKVHFSSWRDGDASIYYHGNYLYILSQPISSRAWFPCQDSNRAKATVSLNITVEKPYTVVATGQHISTETSNNTQTFNYYETVPIPPYLIGFVVGHLGYVDAMSGIRVWYQTDEGAERRSEARKLGEIAKDLFPVLKKMLGSYVWGRYDMVVIPMFIGGMEIPSINYIKTDLHGYVETFTVAHEMIHSWIGNLITAKYSSDLWINEGLTMYLSVYATFLRKMVKYHKFLVERFYSLALVYTQSGVSANISMLHPDLSHINPRNYLMSYVPYFKALFFVKDLEIRVGGPENMLTFIRILLNNFAYGNISTEDFIETFISAFPTVYVPWDDWMYVAENTGKLEKQVYEKLYPSG